MAETLCPGDAVAHAAKAVWRKGRGRLGVLDPLIGSWHTTAESPMGRIECRRAFAWILDRACVQLVAHWNLPGGKRYEELAVYAADPTARVAFWSFTSDGKRSHGVLTEAGDVHPEALAFQAEMPAGLARMVYWPGDPGLVNFAVEARTRKGWNRFLHHQYQRVPAAAVGGRRGRGS